MSEQPFKQLQAHKDSVRDKLQGVLSTISKVPSLIHGETSKQLTAVTAELLSREASHDRTKQSLDALPKELSHFDKLLDDALSRSHDITSSLYIVKAFDNRTQQTAKDLATTSSSSKKSGNSSSR